MQTLQFKVICTWQEDCSWWIPITYLGCISSAEKKEEFTPNRSDFYYYCSPLISLLLCCFFSSSLEERISRKRNMREQKLPGMTACVCTSCVMKEHINGVVFHLLMFYRSAIIDIHIHSHFFEWIKCNRNKKIHSLIFFLHTDEKKVTSIKCNAGHEWERERKTQKNAQWVCVDDHLCWCTLSALHTRSIKDNIVNIISWSGIKGEKKYFLVWCSRFWLNEMRLERGEDKKLGY